MNYLGRRSPKSTNEHEGSTADLSVATLDSTRGNYFKKGTREPSAGGLRRCILRWRGIEVADRVDGDLWRTVSREIQAKASRSLSAVYIRGRVYSRLRGVQGHSMVLPRVMEQCNPHPEDRQRRSGQSSKNVQIPQRQPPHPAPISLSPIASPERLPGNRNDTREGETSGYPPEAHPDEYGFGLDEEIVSFSWDQWLLGIKENKVPDSCWDLWDMSPPNTPHGSPIPSEGSWVLEAPLLARSEEWFDGFTVEEDARVREAVGWTLAGPPEIARGAQEQGEDRVSQNDQNCVKEKDTVYIHNKY